MIVGIVGPPGSGRHTLATALAAAEGLVRLDFAAIRSAIARAATAATRQAKELVDRGVPVPDETTGRIVRDAAGQRDAVVVGAPRSEAQWGAMAGGDDASVLGVLALDATEALLDARRAARGLPPVAVTHPGGLERIAHQLAPVLARAAADDCLLRLDAARPPHELLAASVAFVQDLRARSRSRS
ncbi:MAG: nucleoside monophosphate kinase [Planctomycetota bacterium]